MTLKQRILRLGESIVLGVLPLVTLTVAVAVIVTEFLGWHVSLREYVPAGTLVLFSTFVFHYFVHQRAEDDAGCFAKLGVRRLFRGKMDTEQRNGYIALLDNATKELFVVGITLRDTLSDSVLPSKLKAGCRIRLLMLHPKHWRNREPILDPVVPQNENGLRDYYGIGFRAMDELASRVTDEWAGTLEVRFYDQAPTLSLLYSKGKSKAQKLMRIQMTPHNSSLEDGFRPIMDLEPTPGEDGLLEEFSKRYENLWEKAERYLWIGRKQDHPKNPNAGNVWRNQDLQQTIQGILDGPKVRRRTPVRHDEIARSPEVEKT